MGRTASAEPRKYQIQSLWDQSHQILRLTVLGYKPKQIADLLGITPETVGNCIHSELGRRQLAILRGAADAATLDVKAEISRLAREGLPVLEDIMKDPNQKPELRSHIARDMLDRDGFGAPKIIQGQFAHTHLTKEDLDDIKKRAASIRATQEPKALSTDIIDVEEVPLNFKTTLEETVCLEK